MISITSLGWTGTSLKVLDQRKLPHEVIWNEYTTVESVAQAIETMQVRGAPAIGIAAAFGVVLGVRQNPADRQNIIERLRQTRPTAVNLHWALDRMQATGLEALEQEAIRIQQEDQQACEAMGALGADAIAARTQKPVRILTHCNTGALATGGSGTALAVIKTLHQRGLLECVFVDETRPWLQGSRLTAWELQQCDIPHQVIADSAAAHVMAMQQVDWVVVGADRIAANGDVANKVGTYQLAVCAKYHQVSFMVVAPTSTLDLSLSSGADIPIEQRSPEELLAFRGHPVGNPGSPVYNPVFDVTSAALIDVWVTEKGLMDAW